MKVKIKNRSDSYVGYSIPDMNLVRNFAPNEEKTVDVLEVEKLAYQDGGQELLDGYFMIEDEKIAEQLSPQYAKEPEYKYNIEDIKNIIKFGSIDEFLDVLDFAPSGTIETIKSLCATLPVTDTQKINVIRERFGINLNSIIENIKEEDSNASASLGKERRVPVKDSSYKVVRRADN